MSLPQVVQNQGLQEAQQWTPEQMRLITDVVARGATPDELKLFLYRCRNMGLDPLKPGQIHFIKYNANSPGTMVVGIEGFRSIASRTGKLSGIQRGPLKDARGVLIGGWAEVYRTDWNKPAREEVPLAEYNTGKGPWAKMPETMIKKVAEAAALRMAFPDHLGGVYESAEMDQAESQRTRAEQNAVGMPNIKPEQPAPEDGVQDFDSGYRVDFGKWNKRSLEEIYRNDGPEEIANYIYYLEDSAKKQGKSIDPNSKPGVFIRAAEQFLGAMENAVLEPGAVG